MNGDGDPFDPATAWEDPPGMGRSIVIGVAVAALVSFLAVCVTVLADGESLGSAIGLGLFIAFWGGLGFGAMVGGVVFASRVEREGHGTH